MEDLEDFAARVRAFVGRHRPVRGVGSRDGAGAFAVIPDKPEAVERAELAEHLEWRRTCFDKGFGWVDGPVQYGGQGLSRRHAQVFREVEREFDVPDEAYTRFSVAILCPTLVTHASAALNDELLARLRRTDLVACQLFSEPDAGSHMSAARTRAHREGENWVVTGQKVWTSGAHYSDVGLLLARTTPGTTGQRGLTTFLIDLAQPGVEVRPIRQLTGGASFSEVFLTEAVVPDSRRVGEVDGGWDVIGATMRHERSAIGEEGGVDLVLAQELVRLARSLGRWEEPNVRDAVADTWVRAHANRLLTGRYARRGEASGGPGPEMSLSKLLLTANLSRIAEVAEDLLGEGFTADDGASGSFAWHQLALTTPGLRIGGGTDEIMRDIVGQHVLGLPR